MSSATPLKTATTIADGKSARPGQYEVARPGGKCSICQADIAPGTKIMAGLRETPTGFERIDTMVECWAQVDKNSLLAFWQSAVPIHEAKKKVFVDDAVLCDLFERLKETVEESKLNFRFVLGLILMRKRMLVYESSRIDEGKEIWTVRFRGKEALNREEKLDLLNPQLNEQQVAEVSQQLGEILAEEL